MCEHAQRRSASSRSLDSVHQMQGGIVTSRLRPIILALVAFSHLAAGLAVPASAVAAPRSSSAIGADIQYRQAQVEAIRMQLDSMRSEVATLLVEYDRATAALDVTRQEADMTAVRIGQIEIALAESHRQLDARAIRMYKSGGLDMLELFIGTDSLEDLVSRLDFMMLLQRHDAGILEQLRADREESTLLQGQLQQREAQLVALQREADARRALVEAAIVRQREAMQALDVDLVQLVMQQEEAKAAAAAAAAAAAVAVQFPSGMKPPVGFDPNSVISDETYLASSSMDATMVQAWLDGQPGTLKSFSAPDHSGVTKTAAQMIAEAALHHGVNPKVILVTLQKEQSLISRKNPSQKAYDWAMGCGKTDSKTLWQFKGFGNQVWWGAQKLVSNRATWSPGISRQIDGSWVYPTNASTWAQYKYTPHFKGVASFWKLYWGYFGDPMITGS